MNRPIRLTISDPELIDYTPSNTPETLNRSVESFSNLSNIETYSSDSYKTNISPMSNTSYSPARRIPIANRVSTIIANAIPFLNNDSRVNSRVNSRENSVLRLPTNQVELDDGSFYSTTLYSDATSSYICNFNCFFLCFLNSFIFLFFSFLNNNSVNDVNPKNLNWAFYTITLFPECNDVRNEIWRLISYSFVHNGISHLLGNLLGILVLSVLLKRMQNNSIVILIYFITVVNSALSFHLTNPNMILIGASGGVYGLVGSNISNYVLNYDSFYNYEVFYFYVSNFLFILIDIINFFLFYSEKVAYQTHWYSLLFGLLTGFIFYSHKKKKKYKLYIQYVGTIIFCYLNSLLIFNMIYNHPSKFKFSYFKFQPVSSCCLDYLQSVNKTTFVCNNEKYLDFI